MSLMGDIMIKILFIPVTVDFAFRKNSLPCLKGGPPSINQKASLA